MIKTHTDAQTKYDVKEKQRKAHQLWGHCPHCSEGCGGVHMNGACWHTAVASTPRLYSFLHTMGLTSTSMAPSASNFQLWGRSGAL